MKLDNLETFLLKEREHFDTAVPSLKVWAAIDKKLDEKEQTSKRIRLWPIVRMAVAVVALLVIGGVAGSYLTQIRSQNPSLALQHIAPELSELENYYNKEVEQKLQQLASYEQDEAVARDLADIDAVMEELKKDLLNAPKGSEEHIIGTIIKSYQTKIAILERVLNRIQSTNPKLSKPGDDEISI